MEFIVNRNTWLRGFKNPSDHAKDQPSMLQNKDGQCCCLGFLSLACGYTEDQIEGIEYPSTVVCNFNGNGNRYPVATLAQEGYIASINDDSMLLDPQREEKLTKIFADLDITVTFED